MSTSAEESKEPAQRAKRLAKAPKKGTLVRLASASTVGVVEAIIGDMAMVKWPEHDRTHIHRWQYLVEVSDTARPETAK